MRGQKFRLHKELLLWPHLVIKFYDKGFKPEDPKETSRVVLPLFLFADSFISQAKIKFALAMLMSDDHLFVKTSDNKYSLLNGWHPWYS